MQGSQYRRHAWEHDAPAEEEPVGNTARALLHNDALHAAAIGSVFNVHGREASDGCDHVPAQHSERAGRSVDVRLEGDGQNVVEEVLEALD